MITDGGTKERADASLAVSLVRYAALAVITAGLAAAAVWSVRAARADYGARQMTIAGTDQAIALMPGQAFYQFQLAMLLSEDDPHRAFAALERAVVLNPYDSRSLVELALRVEAEGRNDLAEQYLLRAAEVDKEYLPRWSLANFYFRRGDTGRFWMWAKSAATMLWGDPLPLFRLCGTAVEDGKLLDRLEIRNPDVQANYIVYLLSKNRIDLIEPSSRRLLDQHREKDAPILLTACDRLVAAKFVDAALVIWNGLAAAHLVSSRPLDPSAGDILPTDDFTQAPSSQGFDWRLPVVDGVSASREEAPPGLRLTFSGRQAENCELLYRVLPVLENTAYEFNIAYRTAEIASQTGLAWRIADIYGDGILADSGSLSSESDAQARLRFTTPPGCRMVRLILAYGRTTGTTRIEGSIVLRGAGLKRAASIP